MRIKLKIAIVDASFFSLPYDTELAQALSELGEDVLLFGRGFRKCEDRVIPKNIKHIPHFYRLSDSFSERFPDSKTVKAIKAIEHIVGLATLFFKLRRYKPDIVHLQWAPFPLVDYFFLKSLIRKIPVVFTAHNSIAAHGVKKSFLQVAGLDRVAISASVVIVHTEKTKSSFLEKGIDSNDLIVIPHPPISLRGPKPEIISAAKSSKKKSINILLFGALKPYKGLNLLVEAALELNEAGVRFNLSVVGKPFYDLEPIMRMVREANAESYIKFDLGFKTEAILHEVITCSDIVVFPYMEIDASGALSLMRPYRKAIVVTNVGVFSELKIPEEVESFCRVPPGGKEELKFALSRLIQDSESRAKNIKFMTESLSGLGTWKDSALKHIDVYQKLVS